MLSVSGANKSKKKPIRHPKGNMMEADGHSIFEAYEKIRLGI